MLTPNLASVGLTINVLLRWGLFVVKVGSKNTGDGGTLRVAVDGVYDLSNRAHVLVLRNAFLEHIFFYLTCVARNW